MQEDWHLTTVEDLIRSNRNQKDCKRLTWYSIFHRRQGYKQPYWSGIYKGGWWLF
jgi:hypothetical protein